MKYFFIGLIICAIAVMTLGTVLPKQTTTIITKFAYIARQTNQPPEESKVPLREIEQGLERKVIAIVNEIRVERNTNVLVWNDTLYKYSKQHSISMAEAGGLFHSSIDKPYAENAWGGEGFTLWSAESIVNSWMQSELHRTWLLCPSLKHIAVGVVKSKTGMYASWTFWRSETQSSDWWYQYNPGNPPDWWELNWWELNWKTQ